MDIKKINVKFCGLKNQIEIDACTNLGVNYIGFVFHKSSPRFISIQQFAALNLTKSPCVVAVFQNPTIESINNTIQANRVDFIQIHGSANELIYKEFYGKIGIIRAISTGDSLAGSNCDFLLFDGKQSGSGVSRDFSFSSKIQTTKPFFLAGGININNFKNAIQYTNYIDLSSGVEKKRGVKSIEKMQNFMKGVRSIT